MELSNEDIILLQAFIGGRLDELERNAFLTRLQNEPHLQREFQRLTDKELSSFIRQYEREKLRHKLANIRVDAADDFENVFKAEGQGRPNVSSKASKSSFSGGSKSHDNSYYTKKNSRNPINFLRIAAAIVLAAFIGGLGLWYFDEEDKVIKVADKNQTLDSIKLDSEGNPNDTTSSESTNTNKNSTGGNKSLEEQESRILLRNIRVINKNNFGFGPKAIKKDSLMITLISQNEEAWYSCKEGKIVLWLPANQMNQFKSLTARQFVYISGSDVLDRGLYLKLGKTFYFIKCYKQSQSLEQSIVRDQVELEELEELFNSK